MDKLTIFGKHDDKTIAQMQKCLSDDRATAGVLCADGHLGYAQPVGGVIAYYDSISVSGSASTLPAATMPCERT